MIKKLTLVIIVLFLLLLPFKSSEVLADREATRSLTPLKTFKPLRATESGQNQQQRIDNLKKRASREIDRRLEALNVLINRIDSMKRLSAEQKASLTASVETNIADLTSLKSKIAADTDFNILKTDVASIVKSYRIYLLFMPKVHLLASADKALDVSDELATLSAKLQTRIDEAKTNGHDVTALQTLLTEMNGKIADSKTQAQKAIDLVLPLMAEGYPGNKPQLESARNMIKTSFQDLITASQDAKKIIVTLKTQLNGLPKPEASGSATPFATGSAIP